MNWFKRKTEEVKPTEVCGFLDNEGTFFQNKEKRDASNRKIQHDNLIKYISTRFDSIMRSHRFKAYEDLKLFEKLPDADKVQILELAAEYLKAKQQIWE
jgi:hypothetical protein